MTGCWKLQSRVGALLPARDGSESECFAIPNLIFSPFSLQSNFTVCSKSPLYCRGTVLSLGVLLGELWRSEALNPAAIPAGEMCDPLHPACRAPSSSSSSSPCCCCCCASAIFMMWLNMAPWGHGRPWTVLNKSSPHTHWQQALAGPCCDAPWKPWEEAEGCNRSRHRGSVSGPLGGQGTPNVFCHGLQDQENSGAVYMPQENCTLLL